jgi:hypothetical protein
MKIARYAHAVGFAAMLAAAGTTSAFAESTNSQTFDGWANQTATTNNGRVPRDLYMTEMGRRWDADGNRIGTRDAYMTGLGKNWEKYDSDKRGLTPAQISQMTGNVDSSTSGTPKSGSGVQPGNMGPANSKAQ